MLGYGFDDWLVHKQGRHNIECIVFNRVCEDGTDRLFNLIVTGALVDNLPKVPIFMETHIAPSVCGFTWLLVPWVRQSLVKRDL